MKYYYSSFITSIYLTIFVLLQKKTVSFEHQDEDECLPYCSCSVNLKNWNTYFNNSLYCENFNNFVDLNFTALSGRTFDYVKLRPLNRTSLSKQALNLHQIKISALNLYSLVELSNIEYFDMKSNPFEDTNSPINMIDKLQISNSNISFEPAASCDRDSRYERPFFSNFKDIFIINSNYDFICPFLFHNSNMENLTIIEIDKKFEFAQLTYEEGSFLNLNISNFQIYYSTITTLDHKILDKFTFNQTRKFKIYKSSLEAIDDGVFTAFSQLKEIYLGLINLKSFVNTPNNTNWLSNLNAPKGGQLLVTFNDMSNNAYNYSDGDFCKFLGFRHDKNVFLSIDGREKNHLVECTCTLLWLLQNFKNYKDPTQINNTYVSHCLGSNFNDSFERCEFERRVCECRRQGFDICLSTSQLLAIRLLPIISLIVVIILIAVVLVYYSIQRGRVEMEKTCSINVESDLGMYI